MAGERCMYSMEEHIYPLTWYFKSRKIPAAPLSPDMTICDFQLWGALKEAVSCRQPTTFAKLRAFITKELDNIEKDRALAVRMCQSVKKCSLKVLEVEIHHFRHLL